MTDATCRREEDNNSKSEALIVAVPEVDAGKEREESPMTCTAMKCTLRYDGFFSSFGTQCCCLSPILMTDIALLCLGFQDVAYNANGDKMCGVAVMDLDTFAKVAGLIGVALFLFICVLNGVRGVLIRSMAERNQEQPIVVDWFDFAAHMLALVSVPKMILAPFGMILYYSLSTVCQSSDLGLVVAAWSMFNGMIAIIDVVGIIKNWNYLKLCGPSIEGTKEDADMPQEE